MILTIANRKGGVGKTTLTCALATKLAERDRVLLLDLDSQGSATESLDIEEFVHAVTHALWNLDFAYLIDTAAPIWIPMAVGSIPTTVVAWFVFYYPLKPVMAAYQHRRRRAVARKETET